jgi:SAM-dependent methyltransferase
MTAAAPEALSPRLAAVVAALPLAPGLRVLEIGCGPGAAARAVARRVEPGFVLGIDRSPRAIALAEAGSAVEIAAGRLAFHCVAAEDFALGPCEAPFDLAFAIRVGAFDGRHPEAGWRALRRLAAALRPEALLLVDGGDPLRPIPLAEALP